MHTRSHSQDQAKQCEVRWRDGRSCVTLVDMRLPEIAPERYQKITFAALISLCVIVVTGAAVRLTGSGLGCSDWPTCENDRVVAPLEYHAMIEFVNRLITGAVSVAVILAVLGSILRRPRRRDLTWWSLGLVAGVIAQIVLGGLLVKAELAKPFLMGHFLLSMVLVWNAVVLWKRAGWPDGAEGRLQATGEIRMLSRLALVAGAFTLLTGTVVTGSGPHGGDPDARPLHFFVPDVARLHGIVVILFGGIVVAMVLLSRRGDAAPVVARRAEIMLAVLAAQAAVGYTQYFTGVPEVLVGVHVAGATTVWATLVTFHLGLRAPTEPIEPVESRSEPPKIDRPETLLAQSSP